jgi:hypothetical protein
VVAKQGSAANLMNVSKFQKSTDKSATEFVGELTNAPRNIHLKKITIMNVHKSEKLGTCFLSGM